MSADAPFFRRVYAVVAAVPPGRCISYGGIARLLGAPRGARQVGWAMRRCPEALQWQRVVKDNGEIAGGGHADFRRMLLEEEGVEFLPDGRVDMAKCRYFFGEAPAEDTLSIEGNGG